MTIKPANDPVESLVKGRSYDQTTETGSEGHTTLQRPKIRPGVANLPSGVQIGAGAPPGKSEGEGLRRRVALPGRLFPEAVARARALRLAIGAKFGYEVSG